MGLSIYSHTVHLWLTNAGEMLRLEFSNGIGLVYNSTYSTILVACVLVRMILLHRTPGFAVSWWAIQSRMAALDVTAVNLSAITLA